MVRGNSFHRRLGMVVCGLLLGWLTVAVYVLDASLPFNPVRLPFENLLQLKRIVPEGWAFFTRNPREPQPLPFSRGSDHQWRSASLGPNGRWAHAMGFDRTPRAQGTELAILIAGVATDSWQQCEGRPEECFEALPASAHLDNISPIPSLCGDVGFALQPPVPWAWSRAKEPIEMPSRVARVEVRCSVL